MHPTTDSSERREHARFGLEVRVHADLGEQRYALTSRDLSVGGAQVEWAGVEPAAQVGETIDVELELPGVAQPLRTQAEVRWNGGGRSGLRFAKAGRAALAAFFAGVVGLASGSVSANASVPTFDPNATTHLTSDGSERPDEHALLSAFKSQREAVDRCVQAAKDGAEQDDTLQGHAQMEVLLNPEGERPLGVNGQLVEGGPEDPQLLTCLRQATAAAPYPSYDGPPVVVEFDFELDAGYEVDED